MQKCSITNCSNSGRKKIILAKGSAWHKGEPDLVIPICDDHYKLIHQRRKPVKKGEIIPLSSDEEDKTIEMAFDRVQEIARTYINSYYPSAPDAHDFASAIVQALEVAGLVPAFNIKK